MNWEEHFQRCCCLILNPPPPPQNNSQKIWTNTESLIFKFTDIHQGATTASFVGAQRIPLKELLNTTESEWNVMNTKVRSLA